jgi:hypothetical protein
MVSTSQQRITAVDTKSALPIEPVELARGYSNTYAAILRETANINDTNIQKKLKEPLSRQLINRLHGRYEFPHPYDNKDLRTNRVNQAALGKFSKALRSWKTFVRNLISSKGGVFKNFHGKYPQISHQDYNKFVETEAKTKTQMRWEWGKELRKKNVGNH